MDISRDKELTTLQVNPLTGITIQDLFPKIAPGSPRGCSKVVSYADISAGQEQLGVKGHAVGYLIHLHK